MSDDADFYNFAEFLRTQCPLRGSVSTASSEISPIPSWDSPSMTTGSSLNLSSSIKRAPSDVITKIDLAFPVTLSFVRGSKLFKLRYAELEVHKESSGQLKCIELSDPSFVSGAFIHTFPFAKRPIPHLEQPATSTDKPLRVTFLEKQTVQVAQNIFETQPRYTFESTRDCLKFQNAILGYEVAFVAGVAEITSKVRGYEAISQNLRVCRNANGAINLLFFLNCQKADKKRYLSIPMDAVDCCEAPKKKNKPLKLKLLSSSDLKTLLGSVSILFLEGQDGKVLCELLQEVGIKIVVH